MKNQVKDAFNALECFTTISVALENSNQELLMENGEEPMPTRNRRPKNPKLGKLFIEEEEREMSDNERQQLEEQIQLFSEYLGISRTHTLLFVALYSQQLIDEIHVNTRSIAQFFGIRNVVFVQYRKYFDELENMGLIETEITRRGRNYCVCPSVENAIINNLSPKSKIKDTIDRYGFCQKIETMISNRDECHITTYELFDNVEKEEKRHSSLQFISELKKIVPDLEGRSLFYLVCDNFINEHSRTTDLNEALNSIYNMPHERFKTGMELKNKQHTLIVSDLVEVLPARFFSDSEIRLTDNGKKLFLEKDSDLFCNGNCNDQRLITADKLPERKLFFDGALSSEIEFLKNSLMDEQFINLQQRLEKNSMPKGVAALFYGYPGTGKTATAEMLAKVTGRSIYHVDIAASKSYWFGESEKIIKRIFLDYKQMCEKSEKKPILLFNEADALFSKRKDVDSSNVAQTENAIQNIILEEIENLDGILIATTNLSENLDKAFSRRFLFKIKFGQPGTDAKMAIWKNKLPWLTDENCRDLASRYDLSGGEIDNIVRKTTMEEVLTGHRPSLDDIRQWCRAEKIDDANSNKIGFAS